MAAGSGSNVLEEVSKLTVEQIRQVKEQVDGELSVLQDSLSNIRTAATRFEMAAKSLNNVSQYSAGQSMLVPLTGSLYIPGTLQNLDKVMVDVGTGYYIEKTVNQGKEYCDRKISFLKANHDKLVEVATEKKNVADQVSMVLQAKMRQAVAK